MAKAVKIDIVSKETIKPSSPTPQHLRYIKLSLFDQLNFAMSTPILLFYPLKSDNNKNTHAHIKEQSQHLKSSLSKTLTLFYPLAGKIKDNSFIECNDYGIQFTEAQVNCFISDVIQQPDHYFLERLIPIDLSSSFTGAIIQANFFACGGLAIGVSLSHKITDATALSTFLMAWATTSLYESSLPPMLIPHFVSDSIIPSLKDSLLLPPPPPLILEMTNCKTRRYILDAAKVSILKAKAASPRVQQPSRVEAVTAFLWKCLMTMSRSKNSGCARTSVLTQAVNLRKRFVPSLPQNYVGNLSGKFLVQTALTSNLELADLVSLLREGLAKMSSDVANGGQMIETSGMLEFAKEFGELHNRDDVDLYSFTSLFGFPLYEIDFGWGHPTWASVTNLVLKNFVVLIDTRDGKGVEVWMSLSEEDVALFERNQELLVFASINPSVRCGDDKKVPALDSCL